MKPSKVNSSEILTRFRKVREQTLRICEPLVVEDYVVQPTPEVSPPKWHLAHTTWFFETFILVEYQSDYKVFDKDFHYLFNSYYVSSGERWARTDRGNLTRPTVKEVFDYRDYVDSSMRDFLSREVLSQELLHVLEIGLQHEQQHQELLVYDIKYILGNNPRFPVYKESKTDNSATYSDKKWLTIDDGVYEIGHQGADYCFDNEKGNHNQYLHSFEIASQLVTNGEYLDFINSGGYRDHFLWLSEGWDWVNNEHIKAPLYWLEENGEWYCYTLGGLEKLDLLSAVSHISFYEADAYAKWKECRLSTEFEWEVAAKKYESHLGNHANFVESAKFESRNTEGFDFLGNLWEWTSSAYRPYPFYTIPEGALGEYNGKFMINQMVLRGGSYATPKDHIRHTYRNFFHADLRWMCSGIRLARHNNQ